MNLDNWLYKIYVGLTGDTFAQAGKNADFWAAKIYYTIALGDTNPPPTGRGVEFYLGKFYFYLTSNPAVIPYQMNSEVWLRAIYLRMRYGTTQPLTSYETELNAEYWAEKLFFLIQSGAYTLRAPRITNTSPFSISENVLVGTIVGTVTAVDPDFGNTLSFSIISGNTGAAFAINATTGVITVASVLDYETTPQYLLGIIVTDSGGLTGTGIITINIQDGLEFLLEDNFITTASAPLTSPRTAEPTGTETLVQVDGQFSIANSKLIFPVQTTPVWGDQGFYGAQLAQSTGLALYGRVRFTAVTDSNGSIIGWRSDASVSNTNILHGIRIGSSTLIAYLNASIVIAIRSTAYVDYDFAIVLNGSRSQLWTRGGGRSEWTLLYIGVLSAGSLYPNFANYGLAGEIDAIRIAPLGSPFNIDYGIATQRVSGSVSAGQTFTHEANFDLELILTTRPSAGSAIIIFRKQDANNYWKLDIASTGNIILYETIAGSDNNRASSAAAISNGQRLVLTADGNIYNVFTNDVSKISYTSTTSNFYNQTSGEVNSLGTGGAISNLVTYPRRASSSAKTQLDLLLVGAARSGLLHDDFDSGTLVSPRTCTGIGAAGRLLITDTASKLAISNGQLVASGANAINNPRVMSEQSYTRVTGIGFYGTLTINTYMTGTGNSLVGFGSSSSSRPIVNSYYPRTSTVLSVQAGSSTFDTPETSLSTSTQYQLCIILRSNGAFYLIKGGAYTNWTLVFTDPLTSTTTLFAGMGANAASASGNIRIGEMKVAQLYGKWLSDYGIAQTYIQGSISAGTSFTHDADYMQGFTLTTRPSSGSSLTNIRKQDANNYWQIEVNSAGDIKLNEIVAGTPTTRGSVSAVVSSGHRVNWLAKGSTIIVYSNGVQRINYTSATNFQTAISGEFNTWGTGGVGSDGAIWSRTVPSDAITELERVFL